MLVMVGAYCGGVVVSSGQEDDWRDGGAWRSVTYTAGTQHSAAQWSQEVPPNAALLLPAVHRGVHSDSGLFASLLHNLNNSNLSLFCDMEWSVTQELKLIYFWQMILDLVSFMYLLELKPMSLVIIIIYLLITIHTYIVNDV